MIIQLNKDSLFTTFAVDSFDCLEGSINNMPPSIVEYHLCDLFSNNDDSYLNKKDIQNSLKFGDYSIYLDYSENIYLENQIHEDNTTQSLW